MTTLPETNIDPENRSSHKESRLPTMKLQVRTVSFREGKGNPQKGWNPQSVLIMVGESPMQEFQVTSS